MLEALVSTNVFDVRQVTTINALTVIKDLSNIKGNVSLNVLQAQYSSMGNANCAMSHVQSAAVCLKMSALPVLKECINGKLSVSLNALKAYGVMTL